MKAYYIKYKVIGKDVEKHTLVDAKDLKSAIKKIGHKHGYKTGRMIYVIDYSVIGYY